ncbi:MAG: hypothetical protein JSS98_12180 [Bacteroidetes bacterium]|nr:hypothetical protein [Bacteroidota bacterium]
MTGIMNEKIEEFKKEIQLEATACNEKVIKYITRVNDSNFDELHFNCHMARENLKLYIMQKCFGLTDYYNTSFDKHLTPDFFYASLIEECNKNLMIENIRLMDIIKHKLHQENIQLIC